MDVHQSIRNPTLSLIEASVHRQSELCLQMYVGRQHWPGHVARRQSSRRGDLRDALQNSSISKEVWQSRDPPLPPSSLGLRQHQAAGGDKRPAHGADVTPAIRYQPAHTESVVCIDFQFACHTSVCYMCMLLCFRYKKIRRQEKTLCESCSTVLNVLFYLLP